MSNKTFDLFGVQGTGKTIKEAKQDAEKQLADMVSFCRDRISPIVISYKGMVVIIESGIDSWLVYTGDDQQVNDTKKMSLAIYKKVQKETIIDASKMSLAQSTWKPGDPLECPLITNDEDQKDFKKWVSFQNNYIKAVNDGMNSTAAHEYAIGKWGSNE